ncbi:MAG: Nramp family divalent metal transporter [Planctomycetota bacterium]|jgi:Mn2+/Fe2+ NRAMP family transporter
MNITQPKVIVSFFGRLGPGLLLAATAIGASHLVMSPKAGSMFGFQLLWLVPLTHLFKYHAFEFGPRYAAATGESLIAGYMRLPGPRGWALWIFLFGTVAQGVGVLAGVVSIAAAVLYAFVGRMPFEFYSALVIATVLGFLFLGGYGWLDFLNKIMMTVLFLATAAVFVPVVPRPGVFVHFVVPSIPAGSIPLIAAILGWMPTGIDVSIWHSLWTLQKHPELASPREPAAGDSARKLRILRFALTDMRIGYVLSFVVASVFLLLGALFLHGTSRQIDGVEFAESLAAIYTQQIGPWMYFVFMVAAFSAMYSTTYTVMDGFSRSFAETVSTLRPDIRAKWWARLYWTFVLATATFAFVMAVTIRNPVTLVMVVALLSLCVAPLYYWLNYYCVTRFIKEQEFRPGMAARVLAVMGIAIMFLATLVYISSKLNILK